MNLDTAIKILATAHTDAFAEGDLCAYLKAGVEPAALAILAAKLTESHTLPCSDDESPAYANDIARFALSV